MPAQSRTYRARTRDFLATIGLPEIPGLTCGLWSPPVSPELAYRLELTLSPLTANSKVAVYSRKLQCFFFGQPHQQPVSLDFIELVPS